MCRAATCSTCNGKTWFGCGAHKPSVLDHVPKDQWCTCAKKPEDAGDEYPPMGSMPSFINLKNIMPRIWG
ncbi:hypothetical protein TWF730_008073 [Orbilia blumenaviensis]|uniref:Uncharacterized protein n=1 Tax=Orbilia blumenaviensis TaxID=1796055 RepID=A0AAV9VCE7_9PEZI